MKHRADLVIGYGPSGPSSQQAGYDMIAGAEAGLLHLTGEKGGPPVRPGLGLTDICTGLFTHGAIIAALVRFTLSILSSTPVRIPIHQSV